MYNIFLESESELRKVSESTTTTTATTGGKRKLTVKTKTI